VAAATAESERRAAETLAATKAKAAEAIAAALAGAHAERDQAVAAATAERDKKAAEALAAAEAKAEEAVAVALAKARVEKEQAVAAATAESERRAAETLAATKAKAAEAVAAAHAEARAEKEQAVAAATAESDKKAAEALAAAEVKAEGAVAVALAKARAEKEQAVAAATAESERRVAEVLAAVETKAAEVVAAALAESRSEKEHAVAAATAENDKKVAEAYATGEVKTTEAIVAALAEARAEGEQAVAASTAQSDKKAAESFAAAEVKAVEAVAAALADARVEKEQAVASVTAEIASEAFEALTAAKAKVKEAVVVAPQDACVEKELAVAAATGESERRDSEALAAVEAKVEEAREERRRREEAVTAAVEGAEIAELATRTSEVLHEEREAALEARMPAPSTELRNLKGLETVSQTAEKPKEALRKPMTEPARAGPRAIQEVAADKAQMFRPSAQGEVNTVRTSAAKGAAELESIRFEANAHIATTSGKAEKSVRVSRRDVTEACLQTAYTRQMALIAQEKKAWGRAMIQHTSALLGTDGGERQAGAAFTTVAKHSVGSAMGEHRRTGIEEREGSAFVAGCAPGLPMCCIETEESAAVRLDWTVTSGGVSITVMPCSPHSASRCEMDGSEKLAIFQPMSRAESPRTPQRHLGTSPKDFDAVLSGAWHAARSSPVATMRRPSRSPIWQATRWAEEVEQPMPWRRSSLFSTDPVRSIRSLGAAALTATPCDSTATSAGGEQYDICSNLGEDPATSNVVPYSNRECDEPNDHKVDQSQIQSTADHEDPQGDGLMQIWRRQLLGEGRGAP